MLEHPMYGFVSLFTVCKSCYYDVVSSTNIRKKNYWNAEIYKKKNENKVKLSMYNKFYFLLLFLSNKN